MNRELEINRLTRKINSVIATDEKASKIFERNIIIARIGKVIAPVGAIVGLAMILTGEISQGIISEIGSATLGIGSVFLEKGAKDGLRVISNSKEIISDSLNLIDKLNPADISRLH